MTYKPTRPGAKTQRMLQVERKLGRTLEQDFAEYYVEKGWGQKRLSDRWGVKRNTVFESSTRNRSRSWVDMLGLSARRAENLEPRMAVERAGCEVCADNSVSLEKAHWLEASRGGGIGFTNIVSLCPNCHTKLDQHADPQVIEIARAVLLHRVAKRMTEDAKATPQQLLAACRQIIAARASRK